MSTHSTVSNAAESKRNPTLAALRAIRRLTKSAAALVAITALCVSLLTAGAMALSANVFSLVSSAIEAVYDGRTVQKGHAEALDRKNLEYQKKMAALDTKVADAEIRTKTAERALLDRTAELERLKADQFVTFKGEKRALKEVITETSSTVTKIAGKSALRNVGTMPAEGIPIVGVAAIVAATTLEVAALCDISNEMYDLDVSINPGNVIADHPEACGVAVPSRDEVWDMIQNSPQAVWETAAAIVENIPSFEEAKNSLPSGQEVIDSVTSTGAAIQGMGAGVWNWLTSEEQETTP